MYTEGDPGIKPGFRSQAALNPAAWTELSAISSGA